MKDPRSTSITLVLLIVLLGACVPATTPSSDRRLGVQTEIDFGVWQLGHEDSQRIDGLQYRIQEYVRGGETVDDWSELLTFQQLPVRSGSTHDPLLWATALLRRLEEDCPRGFSGEILYADGDRALYEWTYRNCATEKGMVYDQHELAIVLRGDQGMHLVHFVVTGRMEQMVRDRWVELLVNARL